jgi:hypothetical protein
MSIKTPARPKAARACAECIAGGRIKRHHRFLLQLHMQQINALEAGIAVPIRRGQGQPEREQPEPQRRDAWLAT